MPASSIKKIINRNRVFLAVFAAAVALPFAIMGYKLFVLDYDLAGLMPVVSHRVELSMLVHGHGEDIGISTYLPRSDSRQRITGEENSSGAFTMALQSGPENRLAEWSAEGVLGEQNIRYAYAVQAGHVRYSIPPDMPIPGADPKMSEYLGAEEGIQAGDPFVEKTLDGILPDRGVPLLDALTRIHRYLQDGVKNRNFSGFTDAVTALKLGEASCNGKSRAFAAMLRSLGVPARLVGGLILQQGSKRVSHQWVEAYINGHWVPFDTINDHFAEIPSNYLALYYGDLVLFKHTSNVNFQYFFKITKRLVPRVETQEALGGSSMINIFKVYSIFERVGISQNLLKIMLMIPLGALVTVVFRNVIGLETFGTFLPALIAAAARETGLLWGVAGFVMVILVSALARKVLDWLHLLHSPKMAIMLTTVVVLMLSITVAGVRLGFFDLAHITLFPIAIMAITAERFAILETEQGLRKAAQITLATIVVISACYAVMDSLFLQSMFLAFPELLLAVIAVNMWLGKWVGMRFMEFVRFRKLIFRQGA